jgi:glycosyltransferase involved in cell wall biosynthesis
MPGRTLRVLHVICDLSGGGAERLVVDLCRLRGPDVEVGVATVQGGGPREAELRALGVPVLLGGRGRRRPGLRALARIAREARRYDLVHTHLFAGDTWGRLAALLAGVPAVTTEHNVDQDETWEPLARHALAGTATTVAVSEAVARHARWARDVRVIPNGVDLTRALPHRGGGGVLAVGRCVPQKGFDVLAAAAPPGLRIAVLGDGPGRGADPRLSWLGYAADPWPHYAEADIVVIPSRWEGFGLVAVEAMAAGCPVIASDVDGLRDVVGDAGILVPAEAPDALRTALLRLSSDAALRTELRARGQARAARFDIRTAVARYEALYRACAATGA